MPSPGWRNMVIASTRKDDGKVGLTRLKQIARRAEQYIAKFVIGLQQQPKRGRKQPPQLGFGARRRIDSVAAASNLRRHCLDRGGDIA
jgi:hypothetical protein